jgi:hypothetical protein
MVTKRRKLSEDEGSCARGLERLTPAMKLHYINKKLKLLAAVWNAQVKQWDEQNKIFDPHTIASACQHENFQFASLARSFYALDKRSVKEDSGLLGAEVPLETKQRETIQRPLVNRLRRGSLGASAA